MRFAYKAKHGPGKTVEGELEAGSRAEVVSALESMGYSPVWIREASDVPVEELTTRRRRRRRTITSRDLTLFTRQLASLIRSGVPILRALSTIGEQTENLALAKIVDETEAVVRDGSMLSDALARYPRLFSSLYVSIVKAGESGGVLDTVLTSLADAREKEAETARKVQAAIAYPLLVVAVGVVTVFVLLSYFMPRIIDLFDNQENLPAPTKLLIGITEFFSNYSYWIVLLALLAFAVIKGLAALEGGRMFFDRMKLNLPVVGFFVQASGIVRFSQTLALLLDSGIPIDKALELSGNVLHNSALSEEISSVRESTVTQGMPFSSGLKRATYFPVMVANMCAVGEEGGKLEQSLREIADFYEKEIDQRTKIATSLLEPILILIVGGIVGFIVAAMLLPIFKLGRGL